jgi:hypothetical protein
MRPSFQGAGAELRCGYRCAARLGAWTIAIDRPEPGEPPRPIVRWLTAQLVELVDPIALTQTPLELVALPARTLRWPVLSVMRSGDRLRAELGPRIPFRQGGACRDSSDLKPSGLS